MDDWARWRGDLEDPILVVVKEVDDITHANSVSSPIISCQASKRKAKKIKRVPTTVSQVGSCYAYKKSSQMNLNNKKIYVIMVKRVSKTILKGAIRAS